MEQKENLNGLKKYESLLKAVCCFNDYGQLNESEWEGCLGVACTMAVIDGVNDNLFALSKHLDHPHYDLHLQRAFDRLKVNGVFSGKYNVKEDPCLTGNAKDLPMISSSERERNAWCIIAGIAGGNIGTREFSLEK